MKAFSLAVIISLAVTVSLLAGPAYSQSLDLSRFGQKQRSPADDQRNEAIDRAYKSATDKIPNRKANVDPWHDMRGTSPSRSSQTKP
jgi:hypothetical protein